MSFLPLALEGDGLTGRLWHIRLLWLSCFWGDSPSLGLICSGGRAPRPCSWRSCVSSAVIFPSSSSLWQLPSSSLAWRSLSEQHLLVRSAGSTCGMPLITVLIGFLLVPSIFSEQKAGGSRCYLLLHNKCSHGDQRSRNWGDFLPFPLFPENPSKTFNPWEKALHSSELFKGCLCCLEDLKCKSISGFICSSYLKGIFFFPKNPGSRLPYAAIFHSKEKHKISIAGLKFGSLRWDREEEAKHGGAGRQVRASVHWRELGNCHFVTTELWKNAKCGCGVTIYIETV